MCITVTFNLHSLPNTNAHSNEVQWDETEGALIRKYVFQDQVEVPWLLLANVLQRQFVRGTRQDPANPIRPLSPAVARIVICVRFLSFFFLPARAFLTHLLSLTYPLCKRIQQQPLTSLLFCLRSAGADVYSPPILPIAADGDAASVCGFLGLVWQGRAEGMLYIISR